MAEMWDLYERVGDLEFVKTGQTIARGNRIPDDRFHRVVHVWLHNDNEYLISQRSATKTDPLCWEPTGGSVLAGETSEEAAIREVKEELGLDLKPGSGSLRYRGVRSFDGCNDFVDVWLFELPYKVIDNNLSLQKEEVNTAVSIRPAGIYFLRELGLWIPWRQFDYLDRMIGNRVTINDANENEWKEEIHDIKSAGISMGAEKRFDLENAFMQRAYEMTLQGLEKWPEENIDDHDIRIAEAAVDLSFSLINLGRYADAEERVNEALALLDAIYRRGNESTILWRLQHAHFCKRRLMIRTGRKKEVLIEREILNKLRAEPILYKRGFRISSPRAAGAPKTSDLQCHAIISRNIVMRLAR